MIIYEETQLFGIWVYLLLAMTLVVGVVSVFLVTRGNRNAMRVGVAVVLPGLAIVLAVLTQLVMYTHVDSARLEARFGLITFFSVSVPLSDIEDSRVVEYRPIADAGGWGMRYGRFEGEACTFWNARGNQGVYIVTEHKRYLIGSQRPDELLAAIKQGRPDRVR